MKRFVVPLCLATLLIRSAVDTPAQPASTSTTQAVELPPILVEESISGVPWLYVGTGDLEFLSRCSFGVTRDLAEGWLRGMQLVRALVPDEFLLRMDVPTIFILYSQDIRQTLSAEIRRELQEAQGGAAAIAPSMRLADRDMHASIAYIDEALFNAETMSISPSHVHYLLRNRIPEPPGWLVDGVERTLRSIDHQEPPVTLLPLRWLDPQQGSALASDSSHPRALLPAAELFATGAAQASESRHPRRRATRLAQQELFYRWALSTPATREAFWKLAAHAAENPVTEDFFESVFGLDYSELRDRLSDYLPTAARRMQSIDLGKLPPLPEIKIERASPNQIARLRGEWERLAVNHVQRRLPGAREPYLDQARRTLRRAYDAGDRDPRLLATLGLCEVDAGNDAGAREFLDPATAAGVVRPRAYAEVARLRFAPLRERIAEGKSLSFAELAPVIGPLRQGVRQAPPLAETYMLLAEAWAACDLSPTAEEFAELENGARLFARYPEYALPLARAFARHEKRAEALHTLELSSREVADAATATGIARLRAELTDARTGK